MEESKQVIEIEKAVEVYLSIKSRIQDLYKQIWEADEKGENYSYLHKELTMLENIIGNS
jgi:hypothetical protein